MRAIEQTHLGFAFAAPLMSLVGGLLQGSSGAAGTQSVLQLTAMQEQAAEAAARQRQMFYIGGGLIAAGAIGLIVYLALKR